MMTRAHPHIATPYELEAAAKRQLKAIVLPLVPEPTKEGNTWGWPCNPIDLFWFQSEEVGDRLLKKLPWQEGDRLYFAEEWTQPNETYLALAKSRVCSGNIPERLWNWQPPETMPMQAAQHWFTIAGVQVQQNLTIEQCELAGMIDVSDEDTAVECGLS